MAASGLPMLLYPEGSLWRSRLDGSERLQLTFPPVRAGAPRWSPDGKTIALHALTQAEARICIISADGGKIEQVTPGRFLEISPAWSSDGGSLIFSSAPSCPLRLTIRGCLFSICIRGRCESVPGSDDFFAPAISPDGRYIAANSSRNGRAVLFDSRTESWTELSAGASVKRWSGDGKYHILRPAWQGPGGDANAVSAMNGWK